MKEFALYKGETLLAIGTIKEIAKSQGVAEQTIKFYSRPAYKRRTTEKGRRLVCIDID